MQVKLQKKLETIFGAKIINFEGDEIRDEMKYFSEKTVLSLPIPTHLDLFDLLPLRNLFRKFKLIFVLKQVKINIFKVINRI